MKGRKKIFHANGNKKKAGVAILIPAGVAILIPDRIEFKTKTVTKKQRRALHKDKGIKEKQEEKKKENITVTYLC